MNLQIGIEIHRGSAGVRQGLQFDIVYLVQRLFETFPGIEFEEEYFQRQIELVRRVTGNNPNRGALDIAIRDAEERGPLFQFKVHSANGSSLKGGFYRYYLAFRFDDNTVDQELKAKAQHFLDSFALNRFQNEMPDQ